MHTPKDSTRDRHGTVTSMKQLFALGYVLRLCVSACSKRRMGPRTALLLFLVASAVLATRVGRAASQSARPSSPSNKEQDARTNRTRPKKPHEETAHQHFSGPQTHMHDVSCGYSLGLAGGRARLSLTNPIGHVCTGVQAHGGGARRGSRYWCQR
jgi:hypothetical protein